MEDIFDIYITIFIVTFVAGLCLKTYFASKFKYFQSKGLQSYPAYPLVGSFGPVLFQPRPLPDHVQDIYNELKGHKVAGLFEFSTPMYFVKDPYLLKQILIRDFDHFMDRHNDLPVDHSAIFGKNIMLQEGKYWQSVRSSLSPVFTASRIKGTFPLLSECGEQLVEYLSKHCTNYGGSSEVILPLDIKKLWIKYTSDVIASVVFGVECNSHSNPQNTFFQKGKSFTELNSKQYLMYLISRLFSPKLVKILRLSFLDSKSEKYFVSQFQDTLASRNSKENSRADIIQLLMQAKEGILKAESSEDGPFHGKKNSLCEDDIIAQALLFFFAGYDTVSTTLSFTSYFLAMHPEVQKKAQEEIDGVLKKNGHNVSPECVQKMKYLHMVVSESLRRVPPISSVSRKCVKDYKIPATDSSPEVLAQKGDIIWIPIHGLHNDPENFPNPQKFDPERFSEENIHNVKPFTYLPFGTGPRNCIGMRLALLEVKVALVHLLSKFSLHSTEMTPKDIVFAPHALSPFVTTLQDGFWVGITPREENSS